MGKSFDYKQQNGKCTWCAKYIYLAIYVRAIYIYLANLVRSTTEQTDPKGFPA